MEITNGDYGDFLPSLVKEIENGRKDVWRSQAIGGAPKAEEMVASGITISVAALELSLIPEDKMDQQKENHHRVTKEYATSFWKQLSVLLKRNAIRLSRDKVISPSKYL